MANYWRNTFYLFTEMNLLFFFVLLAYIHIPVFPPVLSIVIPALLASLIYSFLNKTLKIDTYVLVVFFAPILASFSYIFGISILLSILVGSVISWRAFVIYIHNRQLMPRSLFLLTFFWMMFVYFFATLEKYKFADYLLYLIGLQLLFYVLSQLGESYSKINDNNNLKLNIIKSSILFVGLISSAMLILTTAGKWIIVASLKLFGAIITFLFGELAKPILYLLSFLEMKNAGVPLGEQTNEEEESDVEKWMSEFRDPTAIWDNMLIMTIIIAILFIAAFLYFRKKKVKLVQDEEEVNYKSSSQKWTRRRKMWNKPPEHEVRKLVFELEKLAVKKGRGRKMNETLEEWLVRESILSEQFITLYAKVRYGEIELSNEELIQSRELAKEIKLIMKQWDS